MVQVRKVHNKNIPVMYLAGNDPIKFLDEDVCCDDPPSIALKWNARHLIEVENINKKHLPYLGLVGGMMQEEDVM